jgi:hypothetical protein
MYQHIRQLIRTTIILVCIIGTPMAVSLALMSRVVFIAVDLSGALISSVISRLNSSAKT